MKQYEILHSDNSGELQKQLNQLEAEITGAILSVQITASHWQEVFWEDDAKGYRDHDEYLALVTIDTRLSEK